MDESMIEVNNVHKRKRYVMDDNENVHREALAKEKLDIASQFGKNSNIEESRWFARRGVRVLACNVVEGNIVVIPLDLQDEGEATDDMWATTSNWYICSIKGVESESMIQIKILGTI